MGAVGAVGAGPGQARPGQAMGAGPGQREGWCSWTDSLGKSGSKSKSKSKGRSKGPAGA